MGEDITHGLPRVVELFEARARRAILAHYWGMARIEDEEGGRRITVVAEDGAIGRPGRISRSPRARTVAAGEAR